MRVLLLAIYVVIASPALAGTPLSAKQVTEFAPAGPVANASTATSRFALSGVATVCHGRPREGSRRMKKSWGLDDGDDRSDIFRA
jgi:hypothetical protein